MFNITDLRELLGAGDELTDEVALDTLKAVLGDKDTKIQELTSAQGELDTKVEALEANIGQAPDDKPLDGDVEDALVEAAESKLDGLVTAGKITPATKDKLAASLIGVKGTRNAFALSRTKSKTDVSIVNTVIDALGENDPVKLGEQSGHQVVAMSRNEPVNAVETPVETVNVMREAAGLEPAKKN